MSVEFSSSGDLLASTSGDKTAKIWETESYRCIATLGPHSRYVTCGVFGAQNIFAASFNKYVNLWRLNSDQISVNDSIPLSKWSCRQVEIFLRNEGFEKYVNKFSDVSGKELLELSFEDFKERGFTDTDTEKCIGIIQQSRYGCKDSGNFFDDIPSEFMCPITYDLMVNPVKCGDGFVYEESAITEWLMTRRNTSPMTNLEIVDPQLIPCDELKVQIQQFKKSS